MVVTRPSGLQACTAGYIFWNKLNISEQAWRPHIMYSALHLVVLIDCAELAWISIAYTILTTWVFLMYQEPNVLAHFVTLMKRIGKSFKPSVDWKYLQCIGCRGWFFIVVTPKHPFFCLVRSFLGLNEFPHAYLGSVRSPLISLAVFLLTFRL